jgi:antitoxin component of RelBE/YafQ-DinJ toxin-antitoxin module
MVKEASTARPVVLTIRLSDKEKESFQELATKRGLSVASMIRMVVLAAADPPTR